MKNSTSSKISSLLGIDNPLLLWMLWFVPLSFLAKGRGFDPLLVFLVSGLAIVPLAAMIAHATENIAGSVGPALGGLLNATFGNATEMVIAIVALSQGLVEVVKASITGTIIANLLLALGAGMLLGGLKHPEQEFRSNVARINASSLILALVVMLTPSAIHYTSSGLNPSHINHFSLVAAGLLLAFYVLSLLFSMKTHRHLYELGINGGDGQEHDAAHGGAGRAPIGKHVRALLVASVALVFVSEVLVSSLETAIQTLGLTQLFTGVILIPLFGGVVEYIAVISFARKNKMDLAVSVAMGSSLQIALFVAPVLVFAGQLMGQPMNLEFEPFELMAVAMAVVVTNSISTDGRSNWLEGMLLLVTYGVVAAAFYFHP
ncbi:MAG: calcium/proton exchanger [Proteobacteria bacterium]|nr:calcium/proton exchanger [Pseudomonadota bacterium]